MNVTTFPRSYGSVFREACFGLANVNAPDGVDIEIFSTPDNQLLGVKRIYATGEASVNVAPYLRRLLSPEPMCGNGAGTVVSLSRTAPCYISAPGYSSAAVGLTWGTEDAPVNTVLSAAPAVLRIAPGERDEMSVVTGGGKVRSLVVFRHAGVEYTDSSMRETTSTGMITTVIDADAVGRSFASLTGAPASEMSGFTVRLRVTTSGGAEVRLERRYAVDRTSGAGAAGSAGRGGRRLAWVNRYGAVDYYTFTVSEERVGGSRTRIHTSGGYRTVATSAERSEVLVSEPCDPSMAEWLAEIFSSPAVWTIDGGSYERTEVSGGAVESSPLRPAKVSVTVSPVAKSVSRKF